MKKLVGIGTGGHARSLIDALLLRTDCEIVGLLCNRPARFGTQVLGVPVLGGEELLPSMLGEGVRDAFLGVGSVGLPENRERLFQLLLNLGFHVLSVIHPSAVIAKSATLGHGTAVLANAIVGPCATIGANVIVNSGAIVEHGSIIGDHCHIAPGARLAGGVVIGPRSHVGIGACVIENTTIGSDCIVGAGAVVVRNIDSSVVVVGVPARVLRASRPGPLPPGIKRPFEGAPE
jgi:sugar O-acyltransferase (sialic acid O-acetyltransferase NeuD family)